MKFWTVKQAARELSIDEESVLALVRIGFLLALVRRGKIVIVPPTSRSRRSGKRQG
jgi:hypothetical protein